MLFIDFLKPFIEDKFLVSVVREIHYSYTYSGIEMVRFGLAYE